MSLWERLPLEDIVGIVRDMDYRSIINLSQTSSEFNDLVKNNRVVAGVVNRKLSENLAGKMSYSLDPGFGANMSIYLGDELRNQRYELALELNFSLSDLQNIITELDSESLIDGYIPFGDGTLYYDNSLGWYLQFIMMNVFSVDLNKTLFVRLLKEYEEFLGTGTQGTVYIRNDRSVDKILR